MWLNEISQYKTLFYNTLKPRNIPNKLANFDSTQTNLQFLKQTFKLIFRARKIEQSNSQITSMLHCPLFTH